MLTPHAFYYSVRGPRRDERPPDVGPNSNWWGDYKTFADYCRRMSWLNTDSQHVCHVAILGEANHLPWAAAKVCYQNQRDFNYLEMRHLWEDAEVAADGIRIAGMHYQVLIVDGIEQTPPLARAALELLARAGRVILWDGTRLSLQGAIMASTPQELITAIDRLTPPDLTITPPQQDVRYRHILKGGEHFYILANEGIRVATATLHIAARGRMSWVDPFRGAETAIGASEAVLPLTLPPYTVMVLRIAPV